MSVRTITMLKNANEICLFIVLFMVLCYFTKDSHQLQSIGRPALDFSKHTIVHPTIHHGRERREISHTKNKDGTHHKEISVTVSADGDEYVLDLRLNDDLLPGNHVLSYQKGGKKITRRPDKEERNHCHYSGKVRGKPDSRVAVSTCHGIRGMIYDGKNTKHIEPANGSLLKSPHFLYDHSDLIKTFKCGYEGGVTDNSSYDRYLFMKHKEAAVKRRVGRSKRDTEDTQVRGPYNSNKASRYVELVLVADNAEYRANRFDVKAVYTNMKDVANIVNSVYAPLNIFIALVGVVVWNEQDEIALEENGDNTLTNFLNYRKNTLVEHIPNDNAQLITRQKFNGGVVGKALKGPICTYNLSGGIAMNHSEVMSLVAITIAHEMGHNFGMEHDTEYDCSCPDEKCIMSGSSTSVAPMHWSSCSLSSLALAFEKGMDYCLRNKPARLFESPTCGNGFVEPGEQCDCGMRVEDGPDPCRQCCDADSCMLRRNATCAVGECCDLQTCRPKSAGTVCRSAEKECDLPEYCTGHSEYCPGDVYKMDATPCGKGDNEAYCAHGSCRSHTDQCKVLWGPTGENSHDRCYQANTKGSKNGNCGCDRVHQTFTSCAPQDVMCGMLNCRHLNEKLEFGLESVATVSSLFLNSNSKIIACRTAIIDLGLTDTDPGLVPDGAKCGIGKMCYNQKCVDIELVQRNVSKTVEGAVCPSDCSGHGVCNSQGQCHCDDGFAPPICALPGFGGSFLSGPATDPSLQRNFMIAMYIIFLGILPSVLILLFLYYYTKHNVLSWGNKPRKPGQSPKKTSLQHRISKSASKFASNFQNNSTSSQPVNVHTLSSPDDMSSSLLRSDSNPSPAGNVNPSINFFGNFKGFSLAPIDKNQPATNESKVPTVEKKNGDPKKSAKITPVHRSSSNVQSIVNQGTLKSVLRSAPPLPVVPVNTKSSPKLSPSVKRTNSTVHNRIKALIGEKPEELTPVTANAPNPRPLISSPILEASTCTAKELISPLQGSKTLGPMRTAPIIPTASPDLPKRPLSMHSPTNVLQKPLPEEPKKVKEGISLNRIASFLKQDKSKEKERKPVERSHSLPKNPNHQIKILKNVDKAALRNLQISNPILQKDIELPVNTVPVVSDSEDLDDHKTFVNRTQSMRAPAVVKPVLQSFGSMRQAPIAPRPISIAGRPTAPPPPLPSHSEDNPSIYQTPKSRPITDNRSVDYVDCIEEKQAPLAHIDEESSDNIYAIIEESPQAESKPFPKVSLPVKTILQDAEYNVPKPIASNHENNDSLGLLGEIVSEIQNRNLESIYSASALRKENNDSKSPNNRNSTYMNSEYKTPESVYSNSGAKSTSSTTSSGYLHPSAINVPTYLNENNQKVESEACPPSPTIKVNSKIPTFGRQVTPPGLKTTSFKSVPQSPKNLNRHVSLSAKLSNSPDLVSSCAVAEPKSVKAPDVVNNNKLVEDTPKVFSKANVTVKPNDNNRPPQKPTVFVEKKPSLKTVPPLKPVNSSSSLNKVQIEKNPSTNRASAKVDSNVKSIADNLNKNKPKVVPKPTSVVSRTDSNLKTNANKLVSRPSNVASLQQKFENRKSFGKDSTVRK